MSKELEEAAKMIVQQQENAKGKSLGNVKDIVKDGNTVGGDQFKEKEHTQMEIGYQRIPIESLPSKGMFYPEGTSILIRAATGVEIKHWSTLNEDNEEMLDGMLNYVIEKLTKVSIPETRASFKDLLDLDRLYIIFALSEYTFKNGENKITADIPLENGNVEKVHITKDVIDMFKIPEKLERFYSPEDRGFKFEIEGEEFVLRMPTIGISKFTYDLKLKYAREGKRFDEDFALYYLFMGQDWRTASDSSFRNASMNSSKWGIKRISLMSTFVDLIRGSIEPKMTVMTSAGEVTLPLNFQGGVKSLFVIPDILDELD